MKKIFLLTAFLGIFAIQSCTVNNNDPIPPDNDTISEVFEIKNKNFEVDSKGQFLIRRPLNPNIFASDVLLIYRLVDAPNSTTPIWQPIPRTIYFPGTPKELDYDFDFTKFDFTIYAGGNFPLTTEPTFLANQTFRIVIVPGAFSNKGTINRNLSYEEAIANYKIDDSKVTILN